MAQGGAPTIRRPVRYKAERWRPSWAQPVRGAPSWVQDTWAVTPVIGAVMILAISSMGVGAILVWGLPNIQDAQASAEFEGVLAEFRAFDEIATNVMHGGSPGKASKAVLNIPGGQIIRTSGDWFAVGWYPINRLDAGAHKELTFFVEGYDATDPNTLSLTNAGATVKNVVIKLETVFDKTHVTRWSTTAGTWSSDHTITITVMEPLELRTYPTRFTVTDKATDDRLYEVWMFPLGALEYRRESSQGPIRVILENGAVITQRLQTSSIRDNPLVTTETRGDGSGEPSLVAMFLQMFADNATSPGVSAGGAGSWPLLFSLTSNNLRANSTDVQRVTLNVSGERDETWYTYYTENYGFVRQDAAGPANNLEGGAVLAAGPVHDDFRFVLMETILELSLQDENSDISTRPAPPPLDDDDDDDSGGPCIPGKDGGSCGWPPVQQVQ